MLLSVAARDEFTAALERSSDNLTRIAVADDNRAVISDVLHEWQVTEYANGSVPAYV